ncbi:hypothetical protein TeGR_g7461, partial [Tetraparma gracilis]
MASRLPPAVPSAGARLASLLLERRPSAEAQSGHGVEEDSCEEDSCEEDSSEEDGDSSSSSSSVALPPSPRSSPLSLLSRLLSLSLIFSPPLLALPPSLLFPPLKSKLLYPLLSSSLSRAGPAFIKWGQWASTRADMFEDRLCRELADLHANAPKHEWRHTLREVEEALGCEAAGGGEPSKCFREVFAKFDEQPVASGSIAQVHLASLAPGEPGAPPRRVAVKVRHPGVGALLERDFRLMRSLAWLADRATGGWLDIGASVEQFSHTMAAQARLDVEGRHLDLLGHNFRAWGAVRFPRVVFRSEAVIIETFEEGELISDVMALSKHSAASVEMTPALARFIVTTGESLYLKMLLVDNLMHADLHPGNIILDVSRPGRPTLSLVDAGMVAVLTGE